MSTDLALAETFTDVLVRGEAKLDGYAHFDPHAGVFIWCDDRESAVELVSDAECPQYVLRVVEIYPAGRQF